MEEHVLVCVRHIRNAQQLIEKGSKLATSFGGKCFVLQVEVQAFDELDFTSSQYKEELEEISKEYNAELLFVPCNRRELADVISTTVIQQGIKQIVIGQPVRTKMEIVMKGSLVNDLFARLDGVDIYIVEIKKEVTPEEEKYHRGVKAYILKKGESHEISYNESGEKLVEGVFFQSMSSQFTNGIFKATREGRSFLLKVHDGIVDINDISIF